MSLFSKLIGKQVEDFFTEIVAHLLDKYPDLTLRWLREELNSTNLDHADNVAVESQQWFESDGERSKIDMVIRIRKGEYNELVFIESKIGSHENDGQLPKYMRCLRAMQGVDRRCLVFITRDYEQKDLSDPENKVAFRVTRWSRFYRLLEASPECSQSDIIQALLPSMKEYNMSQNNRYTAIDLIALTNHDRARSLMDATLEEGVAVKGAEERIFSGTSKKDRAKQLLDGKYTLYGFPFDRANNDHSITYELGYWFPDQLSSDSPIVGMRIFVASNASSHPDIVKAMLCFCEGSKREGRVWTFKDSIKELGCAGMERMRKLEAFFAEEDHVAAIESFFKELIDDSAVFRNQNPNLPWANSVT